MAYRVFRCTQEAGDADKSESDRVYKVAAELLATERAYVEKLHLLDQVRERLSFHLSVVFSALYDLLARQFKPISASFSYVFQFSASLFCCGYVVRFAVW